MQFDSKVCGDTVYMFLLALDRFRLNTMSLVYIHAACSFLPETFSGHMTGDSFFSTLSQC
jgi:hypothetical protein